MKRLLCGVCVLAGIAGSFSSCSRSPSAAASRSAADAARASTRTALATLDLTYDKPAVVGASVHAAATGLPPAKTVDLAWGTVDGGWVIEDYYHFRGKKYSETTRALGRFPVDAAGRMDARFSIPEDYGGVHDVVALIDGKPVAQNGISVTPTFELTPASGPVGTLIELTVRGLGWRTMESTWVVNWDNHEVGWVSAASTRGSAVARFRATGPVGDHVAKLYTGWQGQGYLNYEQSPVAGLPRPQFGFRTTPGRAARAAYAEPYQPQPIPKTELQLAGASLALTPTQGPVGTRAILRGKGFEPAAPLRLVWETSVGSRVAESGFAPRDNVIAQVTAGSDGRIEWPVTIPEDVGGRHGVALRRGDDLLARAFFAIETSIVSMTPASGPAGTPVTIHLKGVGWTEYDNIYTATYDNAYMGYACGFNSQGDVVINFTAAGEPGGHLIDLYPGIYQGPPNEPQQLYRLPQLTYADDHPGNRIPALRFTFEVTPSPRRGTPTSTFD
ncbi:MAG: hypothetical protein DMF95_14220 [Acidobacteria bacterium]|nr:MAG: hypothetical protein DMF95_14220 [Acidobacteriota bacterium]